MRSVRSSTLVTPFADRLLASDLPGLPAPRRDEVVEFTCRRIDTMPSPTRLGVLAVAGAFRVLLATPVAERVVGVATRLPLPVVGEYVRLVRSLGYAYIWETWPATSPDGSPR